MDRRSFLLAAASGFAGRRLLSAGTSEPPAVQQRGQIGWCRLAGDPTEFGWVGCRNGTSSYVLVYQDIADFWGVLRQRTDGVIEHLSNASSLDAGKFAAEQHHAWLPYNGDVHEHFNRVGRRLQWEVTSDRALHAYDKDQQPDRWTLYTAARTDGKSWNLYKVSSTPPRSTPPRYGWFYERVRNRPRSPNANIFDVMLAAEITVSCARGAECPV